MKEQNVLYLEDGEPLVYGPENDRKGIRINDFKPEVVSADSPGIAVHREDDDDGAYAHLLSRLESSGGPMPVGIFRSIKRAPYEAMLKDQVTSAQAKGEVGIDDLLRSGDTWEHK